MKVKNTNYLIELSIYSVYHREVFKEQLARSSGIEMDSKDLLSKYDYDPSSMLEKDPNGFMNYSMSDVWVLSSILDNLINSFNKIKEEIYNLPSECSFTKNTFPTTIGTVVNSIWMKNYKYNILGNNKLYHLATFKQGVFYFLFFFKQNAYKLYGQFTIF
jgi:hypothetical protein